MLLQGVALPAPREVAKEPLPVAKEKLVEPPSHGHDVLEFHEPENRAGEAKLGRAKRRLSFTDESSVQESSSVTEPSSVAGLSTVPDSPAPSRVLQLLSSEGDISVAVYEGEAAIAKIKKQRPSQGLSLLYFTQIFQLTT